MRKADLPAVCTAPVRGFTLIELLVVVAIIGIIASIVVVSLGAARTRGNDAGIKGNLNSVRTQAELYAIENANSYGVFNGGTAAALNGAASGCLSQSSGNLFADSTIKAAMQAAQAAGNTAMTCYANNTVWAVVVGLRTTATLGWCVDSSGNATTTTLSSAATTLNNNAGRCL